MPQSIRTLLKKHALHLAQDRTLAEVRIGLGYTAVQLDNGQTGLACTFHRDLKTSCTVFHKELHPLQGQPAAKVLEMLDEPGSVESAVSIATSNALSNVSSSELRSGDILDNVELRPDDHVGMVGFFPPIIPLLKSQVKQVDVFEKQADRSPDVLPAEAALDILPKCQVAVLTSTSIINNTADELLAACSQCREVIMLGASTPLVPEVFSQTPVTVLSGVIITNPQNILQIVSEGGGTKLFKDNVQKVNYRLSK